MNYSKSFSTHLIQVLFMLFLIPVLAVSQGKKLTFEDVMKWEDISDVQISANGQWMAYSVWPDRGDGEVRVRSITDGNRYTIELGDNPIITQSGRWVGAYVQPPLVEQLNAKKDQKPRQGVALLNTVNGETFETDSVASFAFSNDEKWVALHRYQSKEIEKKKSKNKKLGSQLILRNLEEGTVTYIPFVTEMAFDSTSNYLAYSVVDTTGNGNGIFVRDLSSNTLNERSIHNQANGFYSNLSWDDTRHQLAFTEAVMDSTFDAGDANIHVWSTGNEEPALAVEAASVGEKWALRSENELEWTNDGRRLFFGLQSREMVALDEREEEKDSTKSIDIYSKEEILDKKQVDVWHWNDPRIKTHEKETWNRRKGHLYRAVYHQNSNEWVQLADEELPDVDFTNNANHALGSSDVPHLKLMTWDGFYNDYYVVDLKTGNRKKVAEKLRFGANLSPEGNFVVYYRDKDWHLYSINGEVHRNLTQSIDVPFENEDHDYPYAAPGYGVGGWLEGDEAVLIYDKYDIWKFSTKGGNRINLTRNGRQRELVYRIEQLDTDRDFFNSNEEVLLEAYYDKKKTYGFYTLRLGRPGAEKRLEADKKFEVISKAQNSDRILYSRESYDEYPNVWVSEGMSFNNVQQLTQLHTNLHDTYNWGTAELIEWNNLDGETVQGALIKPDNYQEGKKYPVLIYYYRFFSQRAYEFNNITNDDRPTLPQWVSDEYVVFLPDIRFEVGTPGFASTKSLVPGVQKLIEMGIADPDKLGLHGHSWSGYQTAFMITQTDIFDAAIAGAPVSNMTSAYSGIRWGSGLARQFQYEQSQSRIGGSLWEYPERYIENSPVFFADRIQTPLLIMFGDADTAVPWYQGIELYLAMRRLEKDAVFLQYRDEPHHLQEYANRLDYAIKMKEYFDHYLRGAPAPDWITKGVSYKGK